MQYTIEIEGQEADATFTVDGEGHFTGLVVIGDKQAEIVNGTEDGVTLKGDIKWDGHTGRFQAKLDGDRISGRVSALGGLIRKEFTGIKVA